VAATTDSKICLNAVNKQNKQNQLKHCSICGKKLNFTGISETPLVCWKCMMVDVDS
jgi:hypothetical protein